MSIALSHPPVSSVRICQGCHTPLEDRAVHWVNRQAYCSAACVPLVGASPAMPHDPSYHLLLDRIARWIAHGHQFSTIQSHIKQPRKVLLALRRYDTVWLNDQTPPLPPHHAWYPIHVIPGRESVQRRLWTRMGWTLWYPERLDYRVTQDNWTVPPQETIHRRPAVPGLLWVQGSDNPLTFRDRQWPALQGQPSWPHVLSYATFGRDDRIPIAMTDIAWTRPAPEPAWVPLRGTPIHITAGPFAGYLGSFAGADAETYRVQLGANPDNIITVPSRWCAAAKIGHNDPVWITQGPYAGRWGRLWQDFSVKTTNGPLTVYLDASYDLVTLLWAQVIARQTHPPLQRTVRPKSWEQWPEYIRLVLDAWDHSAHRMLRPPAISQFPATRQERAEHFRTLAPQVYHTAWGHLSSAQQHTLVQALHPARTPQ